MDLRDFRPLGDTSGTSFVVTLTLSVEDVRALWSAAAERALQAPGMTLCDALDTIGPREDPSIGDCIAMLAAPPQMAGCALEGFEIAECSRTASEPLLLPAPAPTLRAVQV